MIMFANMGIVCTRVHIWMRSKGEPRTNQPVPGIYARARMHELVRESTIFENASRDIIANAFHRVKRSDRLGTGGNGTGIPDYNAGPKSG